MISWAGNILAFFRSRLAMNLYFWLLIIIMSLQNIDNNTIHYARKWYYLFISINIGLLMTMVYTNNFLLIPKLLVKKKRLFYYFSVALLVFIFSFLYTLNFKIAKIYLPLLHENQISLITTILSDEISFLTIVEEMQTFIVIFAGLVLVFTMAWHLNDYNRQQRIAEQSMQRQIETELNFLKSQINPHFLFNTLNNLYGLARYKSDAAPDAILKLSSILRYLLYESNTEKVDFEREKEVIKAYIDLELLRLENHNGFTFVVHADKNYSIPPLLWLPVLENVFKHGTRIISNNYFIDYKFIIEDDKMVIFSKNNYKSSPTNTENSGLGLNILQKRLHLLFPGKYEISTSVEDDFYTTQIQVQLN